MRRTLLPILLLAAVAVRAQSVTFISPLQGSQVIGPGLIEIATNAASVDRVDFFVDGSLAGVARTPPYRIAFDFGTTLDTRTISAKVWLSGFTRSETATITTAAMTASDSITVDLVEVPLRIRARTAPKPTDVRVRENGVEQTVREIRMERPPAHFAFVVDRSLSMGDGKLEAALAAIESELAQLRAGDTASLVLFNHHVEAARRIAPGSTIERMEITPSGGTSLRDALASVASPSRTYAIVITDGGDRNSELTEEQALRRISNTSTVVNAIVLGTSHARFLDRAAANTGGTVVSASSTSLSSALATLLSDINSRYLLVYQSHGTERGWRTVDVKARRRGIDVGNARKGYFAE